MKDQTQEHKTSTTRPLDGTHVIGKGDVDDLGGLWELGTSSQGTARDIGKPYHKRSSSNLHGSTKPPFILLK